MAYDAGKFQTIHPSGIPDAPNIFAYGATEGELFDDPNWFDGSGMQAGDILFISEFMADGTAVSYARCVASAGADVDIVIRPQSQNRPVTLPPGESGPPEE